MNNRRRLDENSQMFFSSDWQNASSKDAIEPTADIAIVKLPQSMCKSTRTKI